MPKRENEKKKVLVALKKRERRKEGKKRDHPLMINFFVIYIFFENNC